MAVAVEQSSLMSRFSQRETYTERDQGERRTEPSSRRRREACRGLREQDSGGRVRQPAGAHRGGTWRRAGDAEEDATQPNGITQMDVNSSSGQPGDNPRRG